MHTHTRWGCIWNRDVEALVKESGLEITSMSRWHFGTTYVIYAKPGKRLGGLASAAKGGKKKGWWGWGWGGGGNAAAVP